jgi:filamentous hemagglutinin family protein
MDLTKRGFIKQGLALAVSSTIMSVTLANPMLDNVASGQVSVQNSGNTLTVNQTSNQAVINWHSFNIGAKETTHFQQPQGGVALNRISASQGPSEIFGQLSASGQIILINPAGIHFRSGSRVDVGGLIATTANMTDQDFLNGHYYFSQNPAYNGAIINEGTLAAEHGLVALIGNGVRNDGMIEANLGSVVLASGRSYTMSFAGNELIHFSVDGASYNTGVDRAGNPLSNNIANTGKIVANGGQILVTAQSAAGVLDQVISMQGVAQAQSARMVNGNLVLGKIKINGGSNGVVKIAGKIDASGKGINQKGGKVEISGHNLLLDSGAQIDVSGDLGGGIVHIGGEAKGLGTLAHANAIYMDQNALINANAITSGKGGEVVLWSDRSTRAFGSILARGGAFGGDGGFIETSGGSFNINGIHIDVGTSNGKVGSWLIDPETNIYIADDQTNATAAGMVGTDTSVGLNISLFEASTDVPDSLLLVNTLENALNSGVTITITTNNPNNVSNPSVGNIIFVDPVSWESQATDPDNLSTAMILDAANNIEIRNPITTLTSTPGTVPGLILVSRGTILLEVDNAFNSNTLLKLGNNSNINLNGHDLTLGFLGSDQINTNNVNLGNNTLTVGNSYGINTQTSTIFTGSGDIHVVGSGSWNMAGDSSTTFTGDVFLESGELAFYSNSFGSGTLYISGGSLTSIINSSISNNIVLNNAPLIFNSSTNNTFNGIISGNGDLQVSTLDFTLTGNNTFSGAIDVTQGNFNVIGSSALGNASGITIHSNSALFLDGVTSAIPITLDNVGAGFLGNGAISTANSASTLTGVITLNGANTIRTSADLTITGEIKDGTTAGQLTKGGQFRLALLPVIANTYTGGTTILDFADLIYVNNNSALGTGALNIGNQAGLIGTELVTLNNTFNITSNIAYFLGSSITLAGNGTIANPATEIGTQNSLTISGQLTGVGTSIVIRPGSTLILSNSANNFGNITVDSGATLLVGANSAIGSGSITLNNGIFGDALLGASTASITISNDIITSDDTYHFLGTNSFTLTDNLTLTNPSTSFIVDGTGGTVTLAGVISSNGDVIKSGSGELTLSGNNTYSGNTIVDAGTLRLGANNALPTETTIEMNDAGTLSLNGFTQTLNALTQSGVLGGNIDLGSGNLIIDGSVTPNSNYSGTISGTGSLTITGSANVTLNSSASPASTYSGGTNLQGGTLTVNGTNLLGTGSLNISGGTLISNSSITNSYTMNGNFILSGALTLSGNGILLANSAATIADGSAINFDSLSGSTFDLSLNSALGATTGDVSFANTLTFNSLTTQLVGDLTVNGSSINTTQDQVFNNAVIVTGASASFTSSNGNILFGNTLDGNTDTTLNAAGSITFNNTVGNNTPLASLTMNAPAILMNGSSVQTLGNQTYNGLITLGAAVTVLGRSGNTAGNITIASGVDGNQELTLTSTNSDTLFNISGPLTLLNMTVTGDGAFTNTFSLNTGSIQNWVLNGLNGTLNNVSQVSGAFIYNNISNIIGGSLEDNFSLAGASATSINGGTGNNALTGDNVNTAWNITGNNAGNVSSGNSFTNIQTLVGGSGDDQFTLSATGSLSGSIDGGAGVNTITDNHIGTTWNLIGTNQATSTNSLSNGFLNIENLIGGPGADTFYFADGARITGLIDGADLVNANTLNFVSYSSFITAQVVTVNSGYIMNSLNNTIANYDNINYLYGNPALQHVNPILIPPTKLTYLVLTSQFSGVIGDPLYYFGFFVPGLGTTISPPNVTNVLQGVPSPYTYWSNVPDNQIAQNIDDIIIDTGTSYDNYLNNLTIDPFCSTRTMQTVSG